MFFCGERRDIFTLRGKRSVCDLGLYFLTFSGISQKSAGTDHRDVTKEEKQGNSSWRLGIWKIPRIVWLPCWQKRVAFGQKWNSIKPKNCPHHVSSLKKQNSIFCWTALWVKFNMIREDLCHAWSSFQIIRARGFISSIYRQAFFLQQKTWQPQKERRRGRVIGRSTYCLRVRNKRELCCFSFKAGFWWRTELSCNIFIPQSFAPEIILIYKSLGEGDQQSVLFFCTGFQPIVINGFYSHGYLNKP